MCDMWKYCIVCFGLHWHNHFLRPLLKNLVKGLCNLYDWIKGHTFLLYAGFVWVLLMGHLLYHNLVIKICIAPSMHMGQYFFLCHTPNTHFVPGKAILNIRLHCLFMLQSSNEDIFAHLLWFDAKLELPSPFVCLCCCSLHTTSFPLLAHSFHTSLLPGCLTVPPLLLALLPTPLQWD